MSPPRRDLEDVLDALERLVYRHRLLDEAQGRAAARLVADDPDVAFPRKQASDADETQAG